VNSLEKLAEGIGGIAWCKKAPNIAMLSLDGKRIPDCESVK